MRFTSNEPFIAFPPKNTNKTIVIAYPCKRENLLDF